MKLLVLVFTLLLSNVSALAQQDPEWAFDVIPGFAYLRWRPTDNPDDDERFLILAPQVTATRKVWRGLGVEASAHYIRSYGDIEPFSSLQLSTGARYYLEFGPREKDRTRFKTILRKRFAVYPFLRHTWSLAEESPENNRFKDLGRGFSGGVGANLYFSQHFGISYEIRAHRNGPYWGGGVGVSRGTRLTFTKLLYWPDTKGMALDRPTPSAYEPDPKWSKPTQAVFAEAGFGWAPQRDSAEFTSRAIVKEDPFYYIVSGGLILPHNFEAGISVTFLDVQGSLGQETDRRDQYYLAGAFVWYDIPIYTQRIRMLGELNVNYSDYTNHVDDGHVKENRVYVGFAPIARYVLTPRLYVSGAMRFLLTTDRDRKTLAANYPEIRLTATSKGKL